MTTITHIITGLNVGGAERALFNLLTNGLEGPFRNRVISLMSPGHYGPLIEAAGIPVTCLNMSPGRPTPSALRRLLAANKRAQSDIIQGWMVHGNLAATLARKMVCKEAALVWNVRISLDARDETKRATRALTKIGAWLSNQPQAIIYNARRSQDQYVKLGYVDKAAHYLPNGFDVEQWSPDLAKRRSTRQALGLSEETQVLGFVGRGHRQKDLHNLFAAFGKVSKKHLDIVLVCVGRDIEKFAPIANERIKLLGQRPDVPDLMRAFDILCLTSRAEGFPNVLGEAMATGIPCVTTDVGDARHIVGDTGWVSAPRDSEKLAACLDLALSCDRDEIWERSQRSRHRIVENFSIQSVVSKYVTLYDELARGRT